MWPRTSLCDRVVCATTCFIYTVLNLQRVHLTHPTHLRTRALTIPNNIYSLNRIKININYKSMDIHYAMLRCCMVRQNVAGNGSCVCACAHVCRRRSGAIIINYNIDLLMCASVGLFGCAHGCSERMCKCSAFRPQHITGQMRCANDAIFACAIGSCTFVVLFGTVKSCARGFLHRKTTRYKSCA